MHWHTLYVEWNAHMYGSMPELNGDVVESSETSPMERERETFANIVQDIRGDE